MTSQRRDVGTSLRFHVAKLSCSLTLTSVDQMLRSCYWVFASSSSHFQKASENHHTHLQCTKDTKIRYQAIMHFLIYKIELKRSKDAGMT